MTETFLISVLANPLPLMPVVIPTLIILLYLNSKKELTHIEKKLLESKQYIKEQEALAKESPSLSQLIKDLPLDSQTRSKIDSLIEEFVRQSSPLVEQCDIYFNSGLLPEAHDFIYDRVGFIVKQVPGLITCTTQELREIDPQMVFNQTQMYITETYKQTLTTSTTELTTFLRLNLQLLKLSQQLFMALMEYHPTYSEIRETLSQPSPLLSKVTPLTVSTTSNQLENNTSSSSLDPIITDFIKQTHKTQQNLASTLKHLNLSNPKDYQISLYLHRQISLCTLFSNASLLKSQDLDKYNTLVNDFDNFEGYLKTQFNINLTDHLILTSAQTLHNQNKKMLDLLKSNLSFSNSIPQTTEIDVTVQQPLKNTVNSNLDSLHAIAAGGGDGSGDIASHLLILFLCFIGGLILFVFKKKIFSLFSFLKDKIIF